MYDTRNATNTRKVFICLTRREPFSIENYDKRQLLARYLVEDNSEEVVTYNEELSADCNIVKSVFKKLVGRYTLFSEADTVTIR